MMLLAFAALPQSAFAAFSNETTWSDGTNLYYKASYTGSYAHFQVYLDTDSSASTGYTVSGIGADYLIEDTGLYKSTANGGTWSWASASGVVTETTPVAGTVQFAVPLSAIGSPTSARIAFAGADASWTVTLDPTVVTYSTGGVSYYVSTSGSDSNAGTISAPWRTGQKAANTAAAGATVYFRAGSYAPFDVNVSGSSSGGYITFRNYPGEAAVIDGTGWVPSYDHGLIQISNHNYIKILGLEIRNGQSTSSTSSPAGVMVDGADSYIQILSCHIHDITNTASSNGNAHGILIRGNSSSGDIDNVTIDSNEINALKTGWSESCTLVGNVATFTVSNNLIHDNNNIGVVLAGGYGTSPLVDQARSGLVTGNTVFNCSTLANPYYSANTCAGLYVDGGTNIILERNLVRNCDIGVSASSENVGKVTSYVTARGNLIYKNATAAIEVGGYASSGTGGTDHCTFVNNTLYSNDTNNWWCGEIQIAWRTTNSIFKNNILYAGSQDVFVKDIATDGAAVGVFDYNDYYSTGGNTNAKWQWINQTAWDYTFASWKTASGQDAHSTYADPLFVSTTTPTLDTNTGSPARNTGTNLGSTVVGTLDYAGASRVQGTAIDMGAYEH
ncbi:right-handed parallel beta-helix repeat-containing protein [Capsulimonas corticalis]|nr:right-handed parallel beta-helix repeat-containing protein [Capsulimonas corticalis]